ncbi:MAG: LLM class F420-dependent oxidoreductase [Acidimicrobiales bacterium]|nr:LLM class F420-dependent oxidoreductase [Acidimicrobiales bacterium]
MHIAVHIPQFTVTDGPAGIADELRRVGAAAETVGLSDLSAMDHWFQMEAMWPVTDPMMEGYSTLAFLAAHTETVRLGLLVTGVTYRHPGLLAKTVTTLDVLSQGRAQLGIGAAWYEREHLGLGVPFPPTAERFERLEEALQICLQMWDPADDGPYEGRHYQLAETLCRPAPLSRPRPPILIGGSGERKTLRLVAQYADACNLFADTPDDVARLLDVLRRHGEDVGRDTSEIRVTTLHDGGSLGQDLDAFVAEMAEMAKAGVDTIYVMAPGDRPAEWIETVVGPAVARLADVPTG